MQHSPVDAPWRFKQCLGSESSQEEEDSITALAFDPTGKYLAVGDNAGRLIIFQSPNNGGIPVSNYEYATEIQAYVLETDFLK